MEHIYITALIINVQDTTNVHFHIVSLLILFVTVIGTVLEVLMDIIVVLIPVQVFLNVKTKIDVYIFTKSVTKI